MRYRYRTKLNQRAFTIVELMIATAVLSTILLFVTVIMISIGNLYYKGINQARTQDDVRSITDQVSEDLKLNSGSISTGTLTGTLNSTSVTVYAYCIGSVRYSYIPGYKIAGNADMNSVPVSPHVLWRDSTTSGNCTPIDITNAVLSDPGGTELIAPNSRLTYFCINGQSSPSCVSGSASPYTITVGVAYGDIDLLTGVNPGSQSPSAVCNSAADDQFCATAKLTTTIAQRLSGN